MNDDSSNTPPQPAAQPPQQTQPSQHTLKSLQEFTKYIPLRLSPLERSLLTVLESTLHVVEYTDNVDVASTVYGGVRFSSRYGGGGGGYGMGGGGHGTSGKIQVILNGILEACHTCTGLGVVGMLDHPNLVLEDYYNPSDINTTKKNSLLGGLRMQNNVDSKKSRKLKKQTEKARKKMEKKLKKQKQQQQQQQQQSHSSKHATDDDDDDDSMSIADNHDTNHHDTNHHDTNITISSTSTPTTPTYTPTPSSTTSPYTSHSSHKQHITSIAAQEPMDNATFFQTIFEIGRRNKVLNPSKMRATYGKLMHLLQDAQSPTIAKSLGFSLYRDMLMVKPFLERYDATSVLNDERLVGATMCILSKNDITGERIERHVVEQMVHRKKQFMKELLDEYSMEEHDSNNNNNSPFHSNISSKKTRIPRQELQRCIESISDAIAVVESNVSPVKRMLHLLTDNFKHNTIQPGYSLELRGSSNSYFSSNTRYGYGFSAFGSSYSRDSSGPTLSHSHSTQYTFVWQSLSLWIRVQKHMHQLWVCADDDLLSTTMSYQLLNTGQGLNRVQSCPRVGKVMRSLLGQTQKAAGGSWVGLSVIHLGDRDVPNALVFIDKYTQIPRFLNPIVDFCDSISSLCSSDERIDAYVKEQFTSEQDLKLAILCDYFKHGFDGSGDDGGSCIDGRLTSSWNWTSQIAKKNYYHVFMIAGFQGFDGDFK